MELSQLLRGQWRMLAIAGPLLAGVSAALLFGALQSPEYQASATVSVAHALPPDGSASDVGEVVDEFETVLHSAAVTDAVVEATGVTLAQAGERLKVLAPGSGRSVQVSWTGSSRRQAERGLDVAVRTALGTMAQGERTRAALAEKAAAVRLDRAMAALERIEQEAGVRDVEVEYRQRSTDLLELRNQLASGGGNPAAATSLAQVFREKSAERDKLGAVLTEWQQAQAEVVRATEARTAAQVPLDTADAVLANIKDGDVLDSVSQRKVSHLTDVARAAVAAVVGSFAAVFVAVLGFGRRHRATTPSRSPVGAQTRPGFLAPGG